MFEAWTKRPCCGQLIGLAATLGLILRGRTVVDDNVDLLDWPALEWSTISSPLQFGLFVFVSRVQDHAGIAFIRYHECTY